MITYSDLKEKFYGICYKFGDGIEKHTLLISSKWSQKTGIKINGKTVVKICAVNVLDDCEILILLEGSDQVLMQNVPITELSKFYKEYEAFLNRDVEFHSQAETLKTLLKKGRGSVGPIKMGNCENLYATVVKNDTGIGILISEPINGDFTNAMLIPEDEFNQWDNLNRVEEAIESFLKFR